jgi:hypothetical protein
MRLIQYAQSVWHSASAYCSSSADCIKNARKKAQNWRIVLLTKGDPKTILDEVSGEQFLMLKVVVNQAPHLLPVTSPHQ